MTRVTRKQTLRSLSVSYQKKDGRAWPRPSFFWYDTDKDLKVCFLVTRVMYVRRTEVNVLGGFIITCGLHWTEIIGLCFDVILLKAKWGH